ncbi:MAG: ATP-binding protein [Geothrix sp.]|nr:ATP-binding protein [Geothrix sp.]
MREAPLNGQAIPSLLPVHSPLPVPAPAGEGVPAAHAKAARVALVGVWGLVALIHLSLSAEQRTLAWPLGYALLEILATASLAHRAWRAPGDTRLAWGLLAVSAFLEVPNLLLTLLQSHGQAQPWASDLSGYLSLATGILVLAGVLSFPREREQGRMFRRRALDGLIFATSLLFLLWVMGVQGSLRTAAPGVGLRVFAVFLNAALLGGGLVFMTSYHPDRARGPLGWLGASALAWLAGLSCWTLSGLPAVPATEGWIILVGGIPVFQGLAAWSTHPVGSSGAAGDPGRRPSRLIPYAPVVGAVVVLAVLLPGASLDVMRGTFGIFLAMVMLLMLRQFQAIQDLQDARRNLEDRVQQRTLALEQAQDTVMRTERMNTLALMGAGLAHDLNNLLCAMKSSAELAVMNMEEGRPPAPRDLARIASTADRAALLTRRLMGFVRREVEELSPTDLGREVMEMEATLRFLLPRSVDLRVEVSPGEPLVVQSSRLRLEQMLVNLVANARDAMPEGGHLSIHAGPGAPGTSHAIIEVADSGMGMTPQILERIFEPFFTTKAPGKGTGLGLSSLKAMVEESGGRLHVESEPGQGARFRILLPRVPAEGLSPR